MARHLATSTPEKERVTELSPHMHRMAADIAVVRSRKQGIGQATTKAQGTETSEHSTTANVDGVSNESDSEPPSQPMSCPTRRADEGDGNICNIGSIEKEVQIGQENEEQERKQQPTTGRSRPTRWRWIRLLIFTLSKNLVRALVKRDTRSATIAINSGSERLRKVS